MSKNEDKLLLLLFVYRLLTPKYLPRFWPKTVKADLGTRKLVHREKAEKISVKTLPKVLPKTQKGLVKNWQMVEQPKSQDEPSVIWAPKHSAK